MLSLMLAVAKGLEAQPTAADRCPVCDSRCSFSNVGSIRDEDTQPSRNLAVWNRSTCGNLAHPDNSAVCTNCWYGHNALVDNWELARETTNGFVRALRKEIVNFPLPAKTAITSRLVYSQEITAKSVIDRVGF